MMEEIKFNSYKSLRLYSRLWETDSPKAVLLIIHGFGEHGGRYSGMAEYFVSRGISVMAFDYRGHGLSEGKRGLILRWEEFREDVNAAVNVLTDRFPTTPLFIFGHSLGGTIALDYVLSAGVPPRGLIVSAPALGTPGISPVLLTIGRLLSSVTPKLIISTALNSDTVSRDSEVCRKYKEDPLVHDKASVRLSTELSAVQKKIFNRAENLSTPLLMTYGSEDKLAPREPIRQFFDAAGEEDKLLQIFEGAYHELHNDFIRNDVYELYTDWILERA